jgi:TonB family protein
MAILNISPVESAEYDIDAPDSPIHLLKLQDDLARSRMREAFWISLIFHLLVVISLATSPKWMSAHRIGVIVPSAEEMLREREATFLEMPKDLIHPKVRPNTNILSDEDRVAMARHPDNSHPIETPRDVMRPGSPAPMGPRGAQPAAPAVAQTSPPQQPGPPQPQAGGQRSADNSNLTAKLETPPSASPRTTFGGGVVSAGSAIEQAARAATMSRGGGGGSEGSWGLGEGTPHGAVGPMDILSDTMGVDFGPYLQRVLHVVRENWYTLIPEVAQAPLMKRGKVSIEFAILKNGQVAGLRIIGPSGDIALDRAAYGGITASNPFQPLPGEFKGEYLALRFHFYYNPQRGDLQ